MCPPAHSSARRTRCPTRLNLRVVTHQAPFEDGLDAIMREESGDRTLVLFLGSNIGNFDQRGSAALLARIAASLGPGDAFLIGADLVKPERDLLLAYDDPLGVSAAFNLNVLLRINRELGGTFDLRAFRHHAVWNAACSRMEMFLVSTREQRVRIEAVDLEFELRDGEAIWTESSYKYTPDALITQLEHSGFESMAQWIDRDAGFALTLARIHDAAHRPPDSADTAQCQRRSRKRRAMSAGFCFSASAAWFISRMSSAVMRPASPSSARRTCG